MTKAEMLEGLEREIAIQEADANVLEAQIDARISVCALSACPARHAEITERMEADMRLNLERLNVLYNVLGFILDHEDF